MKKISIITGALVLCFLWASARAAAAVPEHSGGTSSERCLGCHVLNPPAHVLSKPTKTKVPGGWPLDASGKLTCATCHDCRDGTCVLRKQSPGLCRSCHDPGKGMGWYLTKAHLGDSKDLGSEVRDCIGCHNGSVGKLIVAEGEHPYSDHPVGVRYKEGPGYKRIHTGSGIVLVNGTVTCLACHNPYESASGRLVTSNEGSRLCTTCHAK